MRRSYLIERLAQVVSLAVIGLALTVGAAFAHGGAMASHDHAAMQVQAQAGDQTGDAHGAVEASTGEKPCSNDHRSRSDSIGCCTMACHAALAVPAIEPPGAHEPASVRVVALDDILEGRSGDRTERPPRLN